MGFQKYNTIQYNTIPYNKHNNKNNNTNTTTTTTNNNNDNNNDDNSSSSSNNTCRAPGLNVALETGSMCQNENGVLAKAAKEKYRYHSML